MNIKTKLKKLLNGKAFFYDFFARKSYSQDGEDILIDNMIKRKKQGFYVDVGAHHPFKYSNTYFFYKKGWRGINIDAMPGSMKIFNRTRKRDINLEYAIYEKERKLTFYMFNQPTLNSFSKKISLQREKKGKFKIINKIPIKTVTLEKVLDKHLPKNQKIDFLSTDVEGLDLEVLKSNNWKKYKPHFIVVELLNKNLKKVLKDPIYKFLSNKNYNLISKTIRSCIFKLIQDNNG